MKLNYIKEGLYRILDQGKTLEEASSMFCNPNHPLIKDFWDVNCPRRGFVISLYNNPFYKEIDSKAHFELNKLAEKARIKYLSTQNTLESLDMDIWKNCVDEIFDREKWDIFFRYYSEFGIQVLSEISYLREEKNHSRILYDYHARESQFQLLYGIFSNICEYYIEESNNDLSMAREKIIDRLYDDMNSHVLDEIESTIKKCKSSLEKIQYISQLLEEKDIVSYKPYNNEKIIDSYLQKRANKE